MLERSFMLPFLMAYCAFFIFRPCFGLESQSGYQPLSWYTQFSFWLWRCGFHLFQTVKIFWDIQGDNLVTNFDILVFPNFLTTTIFMCTDWNKYFLPVNFSSQNVFWVDVRATRHTGARARRVFYVMYFSDPALVLRARAVTNPFYDLPNFPFDSEYLVSILFILPNFAEIFKVKQLSLPLISLCFLTLRRPQFFMFTNWNKSCLPVNFFSQNVSRVEQPW